MLGLFKKRKTTPKAAPAASEMPAVDEYVVSVGVKEQPKDSRYAHLGYQVGETKRRRDAERMREEAERKHAGDDNLYVQVIGRIRGWQPRNVTGEAAQKQEWWNHSFPVDFGDRDERGYVRLPAEVIGRPPYVDDYPVNLRNEEHQLLAYGKAFRDPDKWARDRARWTDTDHPIESDGFWVKLWKEPEHFEPDPPKYRIVPKDEPWA